MRCARARRLLTDRRGGAVFPGAARALDRHLDGCPSCAAEALFEASVAAQLAIAREFSVPPVDVRARVLAEIVSSAAPGRSRVPVRRLAVPALAAGLLIAVFGALVARIAPGVAARAPESGVAGLLVGVVTASWATFRAFFEVAARTAAALSDALLALVPAPAALLGVWAFAVGALGYLAVTTMSGACAWWIGRDLLRAVPRPVRGEDRR